MNYNSARGSAGFVCCSKRQTPGAGQQEFVSRLSRWCARILIKNTFQGFKRNKVCCLF